MALNNTIFTKRLIKEMKDLKDYKDIKIAYHIPI
jgi:hypothetical protein